MKQFSLILIACLLMACDPGYVINYHVLPDHRTEQGITKAYIAETKINKSEIEAILNNLANTYGLSRSDVTDGNGTLTYSRYWDGASNKHPRSITLSMHNNETQAGWEISVFEWLTSSQTEFGEMLETALVKALSAKDNWQVKRVE